jgi:hypothetical protein
MAAAQPQPDFERLMEAAGIGPEQDSLQLVVVVTREAPPRQWCQRTSRAPGGRRPCATALRGRQHPPARPRKCSATRRREVALTSCRRRTGRRAPGGVPPSCRARGDRARGGGPCRSPGPAAWRASPRESVRMRPSREHCGGGPHGPLRRSGRPLVASWLRRSRAAGLRAVSGGGGNRTRARFPPSPLNTSTHLSPEGLVRWRSESAAGVVGTTPTHTRLQRPPIAQLCGTVRPHCPRRVRAVSRGACS